MHPVLGPRPLEPVKFARPFRLLLAPVSLGQPHMQYQTGISLENSNATEETPGSDAMAGIFKAGGAGGLVGRVMGLCREGAEIRHERCS